MPSLRNFRLDVPGSWLLQSWMWGKFQESVGNPVRRLAVRHPNGSLRAVAAGILGRHRAASYLYVPHGPVTHSGDGEAFAALVEQMIDVGRSEGMDYVRFEPRIPPGTVSHLTAGRRLLPALRQLQPKHEWLLDLGPGRSDEALLAGMRKTTRNLIRRGLSMGIDVSELSGASCMPVFLNLLQETASRQHFRPQPDRYINRQFEILGAAGMMTLLLARDESGAALAGAIVAFHGLTATYLHAASRQARLPASHLIQWVAIRRARDMSLHTYNLGGVAADGHARRRWGGLRLFKSGFGGQPVEWCGPLDRPLSIRYGLVFARDLQYRVGAVLLPEALEGGRLTLSRAFNHTAFRARPVRDWDPNGA